MPVNLHLAYQALALFRKQYNDSPKPWDDVRLPNVAMLFLVDRAAFVGRCGEILCHRRETQRSSAGQTVDRRAEQALDQTVREDMHW